MDYHSIYESWRADPEKFWMDAAKNIDWHKKPTFALNHSNAPLYEWYTDSFVNTCFNAVDRHVKMVERIRLLLSTIVRSRKRSCILLIRTCLKKRAF